MVLPPLHTADLQTAERAERLCAGSTEAPWRGRGLRSDGEQYPIRRENPGQRPETSTRGHRIGCTVLRASDGKPEGKTPCNVSTPSPAREAPRNSAPTPCNSQAPNVAHSAPAVAERTRSPCAVRGRSTPEAMPSHLAERSWRGSKEMGLRRCTRMKGISPDRCRSVGGDPSGDMPFRQGRK